jgi:cytochrome oxidase Cu insertion factor (SCO1/SenC/PrrC family)
MTRNTLNLSLIILLAGGLVMFASCTNGETEKAGQTEPDVTAEQTVADQPDASTWSNKEEMLAAAEAAEPVAPDAGQVGSVVADFSLPAYDGRTLTAADLQGKVTLLVFWFPT